MTDQPEVKKATRRSVPGKGNANLYIYESDREKYYFVRKQAEGRRSLNKRLESTNLNLAREEARKLIREWEGKPAEEGVKKQVKLVREHWEKWEQIKSDKSEGTRLSIRNSGRHLMAFFGDDRPDAVTADRWEDFIIFKRAEEVAKKHLKSKGLAHTDEAAAEFVKTSDFAQVEIKSKRKFENDWKWLSSFLKYLHNAGVIVRRPELRNPDPDENVGKVLTDEEVTKLIAGAHAKFMKYEIGQRMRAKIVLAATTGMRNSECLMLTDGTIADDRGEKLSWVDFDRMIAHLRAEDTKIRVARDVPLPDQAVDELRALYDGRGGPYLLAPVPTARPARAADKKAWTGIRKRSGVSCRFHDLRHTYLTKAFRKALEAMRQAQQTGSVTGQVVFSVDCFAICQAAGLSLDEAQKTYLKLTADDLRHVTQLVKVIFPAPSEVCA